MKIIFSLSLIVVLSIAFVSNSKANNMNKTNLSNSEILDRTIHAERKKQFCWYKGKITRSTKTFLNKWKQFEASYNVDRGVVYETAWAFPINNLKIKEELKLIFKNNENVRVGEKVYNTSVSFNKIPWDAVCKDIINEAFRCD